MRLILHDLDQNQVEAAGLNTFSTEQNIIIDSRGIRQYCLGCFACWLKTPGKCIIPDEYQTMGENLSKVDEFLIISKWKARHFVPTARFTVISQKCVRRFARSCAFLDRG